jgi:hypothetical protein
MTWLADPSSRVYPTTTGSRWRFVASACMWRLPGQGCCGALDWCFSWWQVLGSNQRRRSRRFYRPFRPAYRNGR